MGKRSERFYSFDQLTDIEQSAFSNQFQKERIENFKKRQRFCQRSENGLNISFNDKPRAPTIFGTLLNRASEILTSGASEKNKLSRQTSLDCKTEMIVNSHTSCYNKELM